jgi:hypothetical protein
MTAQEVPGILHSAGIAEVDRTMIAIMARKESMNASQNRFHILGTSIQKFERSTS